MVNYLFMKMKLMLSKKNIRNHLTEKADTHAIDVFAENVRNLLLAAPMRDTVIMGIDPGFRTGCKTVCIDAQGKLLHHDVIYPHQKDHNIETICSYLGITIRDRHTAIGDAVVTAQIFLKLLPILNDNGIFTLKQARDASQKTYLAKLKF